MFARNFKAPVGAFNHIKGTLTKEIYRQIIMYEMRSSARQLHGDNEESRWWLPS